VVELNGHGQHRNRGHLRGIEKKGLGGFPPNWFSPASSLIDTPEHHSLGFFLPSIMVTTTETIIDTTMARTTYISVED